MSGMCQGNKDPCQCHRLHHFGAEFPPPRPSSVRRRLPGTYRSVSTARVRSCGVAAGAARCPPPRPVPPSLCRPCVRCGALRTEPPRLLSWGHLCRARVRAPCWHSGAFPRSLFVDGAGKWAGEVGSAAAGTAGYKSHRARGAMRYGCGVAWRLEGCAVAARSQWRCPRGAAPASLTAPRPSPLPLLPRPAAPRPFGGRGRPAPPRWVGRCGVAGLWAAPWPRGDLCSLSSPGAQPPRAGGGLRKAGAVRAPREVSGEADLDCSRIDFLFINCGGSRVGWSSSGLAAVPRVKAGSRGTVPEVTSQCSAVMDASGRSRVWVLPACVTTAGINGEGSNAICIVRSEREMKQLLLNLWENLYLEALAARSRILLHKVFFQVRCSFLPILGDEIPRLCSDKCRSNNVSHCTGSAPWCCAHAWVNAAGSTGNEMLQSKCALCCKGGSVRLNHCLESIFALARKPSNSVP